MRHCIAGCALPWRGDSGPKSREGTAAWPRKGRCRRGTRWGWDFQCRGSGSSLGAAHAGGPGTRLSPAALLGSARFVVGAGSDEQLSLGPGALEGETAALKTHQTIRWASPPGLLQKHHWTPSSEMLCRVAGVCGAGVPFWTRVPLSGVSEEKSRGSKGTLKLSVNLTAHFPESCTPLWCLTLFGVSVQ